MEIDEGKAIVEGNSKRPVHLELASPEVQGAVRCLERCDYSYLGQDILILAG
jgi:hypothetical protein